MQSPDDSKRDERIYRLTIRALYVFALLANAVVLFEQAKDTPEMTVLKARGVALVKRITRPYRDRDLFRRHTNAVIYEATDIVTRAGTE